MAKQFKDAVQKRLKELPRVHLIPVVDDLIDVTRRKNEVQMILALMISKLHKRGRPKIDSETEVLDAA